MECSSEILLGGGIVDKGDTSIVNNPINKTAEGTDIVPLFQIRCLEVGVRVICGGAVVGGSIFYMSLVDECNTASHTRSIGTGE